MNQPAEKPPEVMIEVLTSDLTGIALDYAVDMIEGRYQDYLGRRKYMAKIGSRNWLDSGPIQSFQALWSHGALPRHSIDWAATGVILEREWICADRMLNGEWCAMGRNEQGDSMLFMQSGPDPKTAVLRCYVASKLGSVVNMPELILTIEKEFQDMRKNMGVQS